MDKQFLKVYQIYFNENQKISLDYIPVLNNDCTLFFENDVVKSLIEKNDHLETEYFGVVSYKLRHKLGYEMKNWSALPNIANHSTKEFTPELFETELKKHLPDVMSFQRHIGHDTVSFADNFHPNLSKYYKEIMNKIGYDWQPTSFKDVFYCNYFVAKSDIYERYVKEMLIPAMEVMKTMPELMQNSNYPKQLPENLKQSFGVSHYTYHTFICERFFSYFAHVHKLNCLHY